MHTNVMCMYVYIYSHMCVLLLEPFTIKTTRCIQMPSFHTIQLTYYTPSVLKLREEEKPSDRFW